VLHVKKLEVAIDEDIVVALSQTQDRCPILEDAIFDTDFGFRVDLRVAFILLLPWLNCREPSIFRVAPLNYG
jgi:hypothetical protein